MPPLLFDENLSPRLPRRLSSSFPGSQHLRDLGLRGQPDATIWSRAARDGFILVTKDDDFRQLSFLQGPPPKVIWRAVGNAGTEGIAAVLERRVDTIRAFVDDGEEALLILRIPHDQ